MPRKKNPQTGTTKSKPEKRDIMTEMFEHFGIKVIDVTNRNLKPNKGKRIR